MGSNLESRALLFGLLIRCPFKEPNSECPVEHMRSGTLMELKELAQEEIQEEHMNQILDYHRQCCLFREQF